MDVTVPASISPEHLSQAVEEAYPRVSGYVVRTPVIRLPWLDTGDREVWAKLECHQHTGSFKYRGAFNALSKTETMNIITASAGNHALAAAAAGDHLGKTVYVIVPTTVSELKVNRLMAACAKVSILGQDLYESTKVAVGLAGSSELLSKSDARIHYLSPYDDPDVAAGAGTMMIEVDEDAGQFDTVVVPLGGGGLAAGIGAWCSVHSPSTRVVCSHPEIFGRDFGKGQAFEHELATPTVPSYSDGLAVQLLRNTPFRDILRDTIHGVIQVSESETAASISTALRLQSLLIEGAAATSIAALTSPESKETIKGRVLLILSGANITSGYLARSLVSDVADAKTRSKLGLRNIIPSLDRFGSMNLPKKSGKDASVASTAASSGWPRLIQRLLGLIETVKANHEYKEEFASRLDLDTDPWCQSVFRAFHSQLSEHANQLAADIQWPSDKPLEPWVIEERYRVLLQMQATLGCLFVRASASNDQSTRDWFFDLDSQSSSSLNYDRYGSPSLRTAEQNMAQVLSLGTAQPIELLMTSSGMAAYQVIHHFILQAARTNPTIVLSPYVYFESMEQLYGLPNFNVQHSSTFDADDIIETAEQYDADVVFVDPVANISGLPTTDVRHFLQTVSRRAGWSKRIVVVDGTVVSGAIPVFDWVEGSSAPSLLYYESASKYLQFGLDLQMGGVIVYPSKYDKVMRNIRRNTGTVMYSRGISILPPLDFESFQGRMATFTSNAETLQRALCQGASEVAEIRFPTEWRKGGWRHGGGLITIRFLEEGLNNKEGLEACIDLILRTAKTIKVPITQGVSFGFSTTRVSSASSMAENSDPFLRISVGADIHRAKDLSTVILTGIRSYVEQFSSA
ncbi:pyridoxal-5'-phosphate-dependent protein beta subunit [Xylaria scruposa]|nr:pyridoxal-5'-phosphate-dependent protein beta subunit [Xylaria scruposa]